MFQDIPLNQLKLSPLNARKMRSKTSIEQLTASIAAQGLINPLTVVPNGEGYEVVAGGSRLAALQLLQKQKKLDASHAVACRVGDSNDPALLEKSLAENVVRSAMQPRRRIRRLQGAGGRRHAGRLNRQPARTK